MKIRKLLMLLILAAPLAARPVIPVAPTVRAEFRARMDAFLGGVDTALASGLMHPEEEVALREHHVKILKIQWDELDRVDMVGKTAGLVAVRLKDQVTTHFRRRWTTASCSCSRTPCSAWTRWSSGRSWRG